MLYAKVDSTKYGFEAEAALRETQAREPVSNPSLRNNESSAARPE